MSELAESGSLERESEATSKRPKRKQVFRLLSPVSGREGMALGILGAAVFFAVWEIGHHLTPEDSQRFLPSPSR